MILKIEYFFYNFIIYNNTLIYYYYYYTNIIFKLHFLFVFFIFSL